MTSSYETEVNPENAPARHQERTKPASAEAAYERLTAYGFAHRYAQGKIVANIGHQEELGYGSRLLAQSAESVTALTSSSEAAELASSVHPAPNVSYRGADLPKLPLPESRFDVVVAFGVVESLEHPEELVGEAKRALKEDGVFIVSAKDKQTNTNDRNLRDADGRREMYVPEFQEMLERHFGYVRMYRQGVVAAGFIFPTSGEMSGAAPVETARFSLTDPQFDAGPPVTRSVIAVCSDAETLGREERAYLLLDRDRRVFDECEERAEDVELMRAEIRRMQETEVQAFVEAIKIRQSLVRELLRAPYSYRNLILEEIRYRKSIIGGNIRAIRLKGAVGSTKGAFRRLSALYRRLRAEHKP